MLDAKLGQIAFTFPYGKLHKFLLHLTRPIEQNM